MPKDAVSVVDFAVVASFLWFAWAYLRGPHDLVRAFRGGDPLSPGAAWRGQLWAGIVALDLGMHLWGGSAKGIPDQAIGPISLALCLGGLAIVAVGLVSRYKLGRGPRQ